MLIWLVMIFILAALAGGQINRGIYRLAWNKRAIGPWSPSVEPARGRTWLDCVPIYGWWRMRAESDTHGQGFWVRPMFIELGLATGLTTLYWFEMRRGLYPIGAAVVPDAVIQLQFFGHAVLICLLTVATFIDLDEKTIPDEITVPGMCAGLLLASLFPHSLLPVWTQSSRPFEMEPLLLPIPGPWTPHLNQLPGLLIALACVAGCWYALLPKTLWYRGGPLKFCRYLTASILRHRLTPVMTSVALLIGLVVCIVWWIGGPAWQGLLTALVGMGIGGSIVWVIRVVASAALEQEAMGFGDVTLMGMIGAFLGWQTSIIVFGLAPFTGVFIALAQWLLTGRKEIAYGPFLSAGALLAIVFWPDIWQQWGLPVFSLGWIVPVAFAFCLVLLGILLTLIKWMKGLGRRAFE